MASNRSRTKASTESRLGLFRRVGLCAVTFWQLFQALRKGPYWWLTPFVVVLLVFAVLFIILEAIPGAAPFVYALF